MATGFGDFKNWSPIISKLIWPIFIVIALITFGSEVSKIYNLVLKEVTEKGRSLEVGFFRLGESANEVSISDIAFKDISIEAMGSTLSAPETSLESEMVIKGSLSKLESLKKELRKSPFRKMDVLLVTEELIYSGKALKEYISTLGMRFVVFQKSGKFESWIYAANLVSQLEDESYSYNKLTHSLVGVSSEHVKEGDTALQVLEKMNDLHTGCLPVVDENNKLMFFADREAILSSLMTSIILEEEQG